MQGALAASPTLPGVFVQIGEQKGGAGHDDDHQPGKADENGRGVKIGGIGDVDGEQGRHAQDHSQALADRNRGGNLIGEPIVFFAAEADDLQDHRQALAAEHEIDEEDVNEEEQHQQVLDQPFGQGQLQREIMRQRLWIHRHILSERLGNHPLILIGTEGGAAAGLMAQPPVVRPPT
ncbi:MAG: hypothetical protein BWY77_00782 [bacterium ADurb.Bin431]|nr:MAG: hypothetical protein BWY77_00782 [bacterium ADurb.Bin431]